MAVKTILVIDDEHLTRISLADFLEETGYITTAVADGKTAVQLQQKHPFDLCIVDIRLVGMNGIDTIMALHHVSPHSRYIVYTGSPQFTLTPVLVKSGLTAQFVVRKPVSDMNIFLQLIQQIANSETEA
jgi:CheY-like chemotaxis protein